MKLFYFEPKTIRTSWTKAFKSPSFKLQFFLTLLFLLGIAFFITQFFSYAQKRQGFSMEDVLLNMLQTSDLSVYIFLLIYVTLFFSLLQLTSLPLLLLKTLQAYCILTSIRILSIFLVPLEAPAGMVILNDPFIGYFFYSQSAITKDLFFSGHVSTLFLLWLVNPVKSLRYVYLLITLITAVLILIQHVHYTIDVLAAPFFAWLSYLAAARIPVKSANQVPSQE